MAGDKATSRAVEVHIDSIMAADTNEGIDTRLASMTPRLAALPFGYSTYRLVSRQHKKTMCGRMVAFTLPGGRILHVSPRRIDRDMIAMELVLFAGERPEMSTELKLPNHASLILGGPRYEQGMLIVFVRADAADGPAPSIAPNPATAVLGTPPLQ
ncbi:MAG: hypothetical protein IVW54_09155 [Candidatus Binataceae bacterium]|nr:hypothetical protein [Candidatus Binataceae bacterium]